jgi:hypothetical protein
MKLFIMQFSPFSCHFVSLRSILLAAEYCFWGAERGRCVRLTTLPPCVSRMSRQCEILNIPQSYRIPRPPMGKASYLYWDCSFYFGAVTQMLRSIYIAMQCTTKAARNNRQALLSEHGYYYV